MELGRITSNPTWLDGPIYLFARGLRSARSEIAPVDSAHNVWQPHDQGNRRQQTHYQNDPGPPVSEVERVPKIEAEPLRDKEGGIIAVKIKHSVLPAVIGIAASGFARARAPGTAASALHGQYEDCENRDDGSGCRDLHGGRQIRNRPERLKVQPGAIIHNAVILASWSELRHITHGGSGAVVCLARKGARDQAGTVSIVVNRRGTGHTHCPVFLRWF